MRVRLTQLDGKLPNLALMKLASHHIGQGDEVRLSRNATPDMFEGAYDRVYGSAIFTRSLPLINQLKRSYPEAIIGGTGTASWQTVEQYLGVPEFERYDYSLYPDYLHSLGFSMRGCRLACGFCVVPRKEGKPRDVSTIAEIWRGADYPKNIVLLDNDFFGQPRDKWEARIQEILDGGFKVSFNQGINVRLIDKTAAEAIARVPYYDDDFKSKRLFTAFDNFKDEGIFRKGIEHLIGAGVNPDNVLVYTLVGYDPSETWERIFHRFNVMLEYGVRPYPMVYQRVGESRAANDLDYKQLKMFQKWVVRRYYEIVSWPEFLQMKDRSGLHKETALDAKATRIDRKRKRRHELESERAALELFGAA